MKNKSPYNTIQKRRKAYRKLAEWYANEPTKYSEGICLLLQLMWHGCEPTNKDMYQDDWWLFSQTPRHFPEYGMINQRCESHLNNDERVIALLFAAQLSEKETIY